MNVLHLVQRQSKTPADAPQRERTESRPVHRERDFGIGYGSSSGYGQDRRYAGAAARPMFRCS